MTTKRFYMDKDGNLYDKDDGLLMLDFGYSYDGVNCKRIIDLLNELAEKNTELQGKYNAQSRLFGQLNSDYNNYRWSAKDCQKRLEEENEKLKKALWCIRKRYEYTVEEFIEDLKDNGIDLTKVDLE